jgi:hypothetical protein
VAAASVGPNEESAAALQFRERSRGNLRCDNQVTRNETGNARLDAKVGVYVNPASGWLQRMVRRQFSHANTSADGGSN